MRLLYVVPNLHDNGGNRLTLMLARELPERGLAAHVFALRREADARMLSETDGVEVSYGVEQGSRLRQEPIRGIGALVGAARAADLLVSGWELGEGLNFAYAAARLTRRPVGALVHTDLEEAVLKLPRRDAAAARFIYPRLDAAVSMWPPVSSRSAAALGTPEDRIHPARAALDVDRVRRQAGARSNASRAGAPAIVAAGRLSTTKGFDILIAAHAETVAHGCRHRLIIMGEGDERPHLEGLAHRLGVADSVELPGHLDNPLPVIAAASALCVSSRYEGGPLVCLEALVLGVPVIATDCGGPAQLLAHGRYGDLVPVDSVPGLAAAMVRHLSDPSRLVAKAELGRRASSARSLDECVEDHVAVYEAIAGRTPAVTGGGS